MAALFERQKRFELLDEPPDVHEPGLGIAVDLVGKVSHQVLEVARDAADGGVTRSQLLAHPVQAFGKSG